MKEGVKTKEYKGLMEAIGLYGGASIISLEEVDQNRMKND